MNWSIVLCRPKRNKKAPTRATPTIPATTIPATPPFERLNEYEVIDEYPVAVDEVDGLGVEGLPVGLISP